MKADLQKDERLLLLIDRLTNYLGTQAFDIIDHWDADLCAIGIAHPDDHRFLVYVSTFEMPEDSYSIILESPIADTANFGRSDNFERLSLDEVIQVIRRHLDMSGAAFQNMKPSI